MQTAEKQNETGYEAAVATNFQNRNESFLVD